MTRRTHFITRTPAVIRESAARLVLRHQKGQTDKVALMLGRIAMRIRSLPLAGFLGKKKNG